ncbi:hypothetical protein QNH20_08990 [Neobacillus sp. WH10]|uniref:hypothetical protein n=1 Tax=Neobacillus sp. WH10 TaxID=3047873 RepID=UPI0024C18D79|nr:hypothetical protein [Neobacillus sp. WH10]WHY79251.1 hypothetical protein QNH20_08990 [Neobacillus sp. WH10]
MKMSDGMNFRAVVSLFKVTIFMCLEDKHIIIFRTMSFYPGLTSRRTLVKTLEEQKG